jgi:myosin I
MILNELQRKSYERVITEGRQEDLVLMRDITSDGVQSILSERFYHEDMYTAVGPVLIAVNPYRLISFHKDSPVDFNVRLIFKSGIPIYSEAVARHYYKSSPLEVAPHIFTIGSEAYKNMREYKENQTIIVTGESGAGDMLVLGRICVIVT